MKTVEIMYDGNNELYITHEVNEDEERIYFRKDELNGMLEVIDGQSYDSIRLYNNYLRLVSIKDNEEIVIRNFRKFSQDGWIERIPNIAKQAGKTISTYNKNRAKHKKRKNVKLGRIKIAGTGLVLGLLCATPFIANGLNHASAKEETTQEESLSHAYDAVMAGIDAHNSVGYTFNEFKSDVEEITTAEAQAKLGEEPIGEYIGTHAYLDYSLSTDDEKRQHAYENYHDLVERFSNKWGISFNLVMAMLTQESGGYKTNLMQIEFDVWKDQEIKVYNFADGVYNFFVLTENPEKYDRSRITCITPSDLDNPITNISIGCVLLRKSAEYMDYHVLAAIQCYNLGKGNMDKVLEAAAIDTGQSIDDMLADQENVTFYQYTDTVDVGDPEYLSNVFAFLNDYGDVITFKHFGENHEIVEEEIAIFSSNQPGYH